MTHPAHAMSASVVHRAGPTGPIVVATAGDDGHAATETARRLAARDGRPVAIASAVEVPSGAGRFDIPYVPDIAAYVRAQRDRVSRQLAPSDDWTIDCAVDEPARLIADVARTRHASLVVVGSGRHDLAGRLFGEVALRVVRRATTPVLVVPREAMPVPVRTAVAAIDFSASSVLAARTAMALLDDDATLHLVHVWSRHELDGPEFATEDAAYERALPARFARVERELLAEGRPITIVSTAVGGDPAETIAVYAMTHGAQLIAAGRQGHGLLELLLVGRVTTALLRTADCALLVTPEPGPIDQATLDRAISGTSESRAPAAWGPLLADFSRRNAGRRTRLEVDDPALGAQTQQTGYALLGAAYDIHDHRVALMLGDPIAGATHLTRSIEHVSAIAVHTGIDGRDVALRLTHGMGQTLLMLLTAGSSAERL